MNNITPNLTQQPIFNDDIHHNPSSDSGRHNIKDCQIIKRLLKVLSYYTKLINNNMTADDKHGSNNDHHLTIFSDFIDTIYKNKKDNTIYDDLYHLTKCHENEMEEIKNLAINNFNLSECHLSICKYSDRHYRINEKKQAMNIDDDSTKYNDLNEEIMDSLHYNIFHLFESGLRVSKALDQKSEEDLEKDSYFDPIFLRTTKIINKTRSNTKRFNRLSVNKYNISFIDNKNQSIDSKQNIEIGQTDTFLDEIYSNLSSVSSNNEENNGLTSKLNEIILLHDYDTDSLDMDINIFKEIGNSNIYIEIKQDLIMKEVVNIFERAKSFVYI